MNDSTHDSYGSYHDVLAAVDKANETHDYQLEDEALGALVSRWDSKYKDEIDADIEHAREQGIFGAVAVFLSLGFNAAAVGTFFSTKEVSLLDLSPVLTVAGIIAFVDAIKRIDATDKAKRLHSRHNSRLAQKRIGSEEQD